MPRFVAGLLVLLLSACSDGPVWTPPDAPPPTCTDTIREVPLSGPNLDLLFVIDDSGGMSEEQQALIDAAPDFFGVLEVANLHVGIVSTNVGVGGYPITGCGGDGDDGRLLNEAQGACTPPSGYYLLRIGDVANYTGTIAAAFGCIAALGDLGCGFEQHLESMKRALDGSNPQNQGFLRPEAALAVIFLTEEDDCSASDTTVFDPAQTQVADPLGPLSSFRCTEFGVQCDGAPVVRAAATYASCEPQDGSAYLQHPQVYVDFLLSLKPDPSQLHVLAIVGDLAPMQVVVDAQDKPQLWQSCMSELGPARPGVRLAWFADQFGAGGQVSRICAGDLRMALTTFAETLSAAHAGYCAAGPACGECTVERDGVDVPTCASTGGAAPCYELTNESPSCFFRPRLSLNPPRGTTPTLRCQVPREG